MFHCQFDYEFEFLFHFEFDFDFDYEFLILCEFAGLRQGKGAMPPQNFLEFPQINDKR
ncbi:unnamed protein product, partial [Nesidiocoris tenuis]